MADRYEDHATEVANKLIMMMEEGVGPWRRGWNRPADTGFVLPYNATTGRAYSGSNAMALMAEQHIRGYNDNRWLTFNQGKTLGAMVRKGEKGTRLARWVEVEDKYGVKPANGEEQDTKKLVPVIFPVFNAEQIEGLAAAPVIELPSEPERHAQCEALIAASGASINFDGKDRAYYRPHTDTIHLPQRAQFESADAFYATVLHEIGHWTGHPSRLARDLTGKFGSAEYAREELCAEAFSMSAGARIGIGHSPDNHASYIKHWVLILRNTPKEIFAACAQAERICTHLGVAQFVHEPTQKLENSNTLKMPSQARDREHVHQMSM